MRVIIKNKYTGDIDYNIGLCSDGYLVEFSGDGNYWRVVDKSDYIVEFVED